MEKEKDVEERKKKKIELLHAIFNMLSLKSQLYTDARVNFLEHSLWSWYNLFVQKPLRVPPCWPNLYQTFSPGI